MVYSHICLNQPDNSNLGLLDQENRVLVYGYSHLAQRSPSKHEHVFLEITYVADRCNLWVTWQPTAFVIYLETHTYLRIIRINRCEFCLAVPPTGYESNAQERNQALSRLCLIVRNSHENVSVFLLINQILHFYEQKFIESGRTPGSQNLYRNFNRMNKEGSSRPTFRLTAYNHN